mgnify:CR=1 FL=1
MRAIRNMPISRKVSIAPFFGFLFLLAISVAAILSIRDVVGSFDVIAKDAMPKQEWAGNLEKAVGTAQTQIFQSLVWQASNAPEENQKRAREAVGTKLERVQALLDEGYALFGVDPVDPEALGISRDNPADKVAAELEAEAATLAESEALRNLFWALELRLGQYADAVERVRQTQVHVFTAAVTFSGSAQQAFQSSSKTFEQLQGLIDASSQRQRAAVATTSLGAERGIIIAGMVALLVLGAVSMFIGKQIANPIHRITAAMRELAGGDTEIEVPERGRGDEVGDMAEALGVFQENAREVARLAAQEEENRRRAEIKRKETMSQLELDPDFGTGG